MKEVISLRQENSKTFDLGGGKCQWRGSIGAIHYKDNYADESESWKDIDLTWEGNRITKAPFELTLEGNKATIRNKKSGEISTIELLEIGGRVLPPQAWKHSKGLAKATDLEIKVENSHVRFTRILKSSEAPKEAKFKVKGNFRVRAQDEEDDLPVEVTLEDGVLTEKVKPDRAVKYPIRVDPTWSCGESWDDAERRLVASWLSTTSEDIAGAASVDNYQYGAGMRFQGVTIPNSAIITAAKLTLRADRSSTGANCLTKITAEDVDNAVIIADNAGVFDSRYGAHTTAVVEWDNIDSWTGGEDYDSPEIKTVIQEIVDRGGWASGQSILIFWQDYDDRSTHATNRRYAESYDTDSSNAPILDVTYTDHKLVTPGTLALVLTEYAPTVSTPRLITPPTLALSLTTYAPSVTIGTLVTPTTLALSLTAYAPTVSTPRLVTPTTLALALTEYAPSVTIGTIVTPATLALILVLYTPSVNITGRLRNIFVITSQYRDVKATTSQYRQIRTITSQHRKVKVITSGG